MKRLLRHAIRWFGWALLGLAGLVCLALILVQTPPAKDFIRTQAIGQANNLLSGEVKAGRLTGTLLGGLSLHDVQIVDGRDRPLATIDRLSIDYSLWSLAGDRIEVDSITLDGPRVLIARNQDGTLNVSTLVAPSPTNEAAEPFALKLDLSTIEINRGLVAWRDLASTQPVPEGLPDLASLVTPGSHDELDARTRQAARAIESGGNRGLEGIPPVALARDLTVRARFAMNGTTDLRAALDRFETTVSAPMFDTSEPLAIEGALGQFTGRGLDVELRRLSISDSDILRGVTARLSYASEESGEDHVWSRIDRLHASKPLLEAVAPWIAPRSDITADLEVGGTFDDISVDGGIQFDPGRMSVAGRLALPSSKPATWRGSIDGRDLELSALTGLAPDAGGDIRAWFDGRGTTFDTLDGRADIEITDAHYGRWRLDRVLLRAVADEQVISAQKLVVDSPYADASATAGYRRDGSVAAALRARASGRDGNLPARGRGEATATLEGRVDPDVTPSLSTIKRLNFDADWNLSGVTAPGLNVNRSNGRVTFVLSPLAGTSRMRARTSVDASVRRLVAGPHRLQRADVDISAATRMRWPPNPSLDLLEQGELQGDVLFSDLETGATSVASANLSLSITPDNTGRASAANLDVSGAIEGVDAGGVTVGSAELKLSGSTTSTDRSSGAAPTFDVAGDTEWTSLEMPGISNAGGRVKLDLRGLPAEPTGTIALATDETTAAGVAWQSITADVGIPSVNRFAIDAALSPTETPNLPYELAVAGSHAPDFMSYDFSSLTLSRGPEQWRLRQEAGLQLRDGVGFDAFELQNGDQTIALDGTFRIGGRNSLQADITNLDLAGVTRLASLFGVPELSGRLTTKLALDGTARRPDIRLTGSLERGGVNQWGPADIEVSAHYADQTFEVSTFQAQVGDQRLIDLSSRVPVKATLDGEFELLWRQEATVDLRIPRIKLGDAFNAFGLQSIESLDGVAEGRLQVSGPMIRPDLSGTVDLADLTFQGSVAGTPFDVRDFGVTSSVNVGARESKHDIKFDVRADWREDAVFRANLDTSAPLQSWLEDFYGGRTDVDWFERLATLPFSVDLVMRPLRLSEMPVSALVEADAEGTVDGYVSIDGTLRSPEASFDLNVDDFGWSIYRDIYVDLEGAVRDGVLKIRRLRGEWDADEILVAQGTIPFPSDAVLENKAIEDQPVDFALELKPTALQKLGAIDYSFTRFQGTLSGYVTIEGSLRDPDIRTRLALTNTNLNRTADSTLGIEVVARDDRVTADAFVCKQDRRILTAGAEFPITLDPVAVAGGAPLLPAGDVSAQISGQNVPLADVFPGPLLKGTLEDIEGTLTTDLRVAGDWMGLNPSGSLSIQKGAVTLVEFGRRLRKVNLNANVTTDKITIDNFSMEGASGSVNASATAPLNGLLPSGFDAQIKTDGFDISGFGSEMTALVTTKAAVSGTIDPPSYNVDVKTDELEVELPASQTTSNHPIALSDDIVITDSRRGGRRAGSVSPYLAQSTGEVERTRLQIQVDLSRKSWLRHPSGDLNFTGSLGIDLLGESLIMNGSIDSIRGDFEFLGRDFTVPDKKAVVRFRGADPPNPALDVEAHHPLDRSIVAEVGQAASGDPKIVVRVTGYALEPRLDLSSDPGMSETDILFVLMTGRPPSNAGVGQDESVANQAVAAASGIFSGLLQQRLSGTLPVDMLRIETGDQGFQDSRIKVGKYITDDIFVSYAYQFGSGDEDSGYEARIEYHFLPRWMVEAVYGANNTGELNVFWDVY